MPRPSGSCLREGSGGGEARIAATIATIPCGQATRPCDSVHYHWRSCGALIHTAQVIPRTLLTLDFGPSRRDSGLSPGLY